MLADSKRFTGAAAPCSLSWAAWTLCRQTDHARRRSNAERLSRRSLAALWRSLAAFDTGKDLK